MPDKEINTTNLLFTQTSSVDYEDLYKQNVLLSTKNSRNSCREATRDGTRHDSRGKGNHSPFKTNKEGSLRRLANLVRKLEKSNSIDECNVVIQEQLEAGIVERAALTVEGREFDIFHKGVVLENAESTMLKIVYNASARA